MILDTLTALFLLAGSVMVFVGALGVARLPDSFCRSHALTVSMTLGVVLLMVALWLARDLDEVVGLKLLLAAVFVFATVPVAGHLIAAVALELNLPRHPKTQPPPSPPKATASETP